MSGLLRFEACHGFLTAQMCFDSVINVQRLLVLEQARNWVVESRYDLVPVVLYRSVVVQRQTDRVHKTPCAQY